MTDKKKQRELIVEIMKADENSGLYDDPARKQTAVNWLIKEVELISNSKGISRDKIIEFYNQAIQQAKQMEKQQIIEAHGKQLKKTQTAGNYEYWLTGEKYYNETYI